MGGSLLAPLANLQILNNQACVHHDVWRDGVEGPHMDPGIACPECEEGLHHTGGKEREQNEEDRDCRVVRRVIACPRFEEVHERVGDGARQKGGRRREQPGIARQQDRVDEDHDGEICPAQMQHEGKRSADELLMRRELKDVGAGELVGAADEHDNGDDERVVLPVRGSQIEHLARVATPAKDEIRKKREEDTVVRGPGVDRGR
jgi:hypothetical protein